MGLKYSGFFGQLEQLMLMSVMDLKLKYQNSVLGILWSVLKPLLQFFVYFFIFSYVLKVDTDPDYALRLFFGIIIWAWFSEGTGAGISAFQSKKSVITKIQTNKLLPILASFLTPTMTYIINFSIFGVVYMATYHHLSIHIFHFKTLTLYLYSIFAISVLVISLNLILANLNILYRDLQNLWDLVLIYGIFLSPIIYQIPIPPRLQTLYFSLNLLALPIVNMKGFFFLGQPVITGKILYIHATCLLALFLFATYVHRNFHKKVVDFL